MQRRVHQFVRVENITSRLSSTDNSCSAGPPQARHGPLGGQRSTRSDKRGG